MIFKSPLEKKREVLLQQLEDQKQRLQEASTQSSETLFDDLATIHWLRENPLQTALIGFLVGFVITQSLVHEPIPMRKSSPSKTID